MAGSVSRSSEQAVEQRTQQAPIARSPSVLPSLPVPWVYVVTGGPRHVKIGISVDIENRLPQLQTGCPYRVQLVQSWQTREARKVESRAHTALAKYRSMGEWFGIPAQVAVDAVEIIVQRPDLGVLPAVVFCANCSHSRKMPTPPQSATMRCSKCGKNDRVHVLTF